MKRYKQIEYFTCDWAACAVEMEEKQCSQIRLSGHCNALISDPRYHDYAHLCPKHAEYLRELVKLIDGIPF